MEEKEKCCCECCIEETECSCNEECTCKEECTCDETCLCGCQEGKECTCECKE